MKTPNGNPRIAPTRKPHAVEPNSQPIRIPSTITAAVLPTRTDPAPARLRFGVGFGSICAASIAEFVTVENRLVWRKSGDFVLGRAALFGPLVRAAAAEPARVVQLDDLEHVDDVERERKRDERD